MRTIQDQIEEAQDAIKRADTWSDEKRALADDIIVLKETLKNAKENAAELLAIVKDLAYGGSVTFPDKVTNARIFLRKSGLTTASENRLPVGELSEGIRFYND